VGTALNYKIINEAISRVRSCNISDIAMTFEEDIDRDFEKRGEKHEPTGVHEA